MSSGATAGAGSRPRCNEGIRCTNPRYTGSRISPPSIALIRAHPLGLLVSHGPSGLLANAIPFLIFPEEAKLGTLRAHVARANPQWRDLRDAQEALVVFQGFQHYVTPSWYETKRETGKVVPTWNYLIVQARGARA